MRCGWVKFVRLVMALSVMLTLVFASLVSQHAMASHHFAEIGIDAMSEHSADTAKSGSCEKSSDGQLSKGLDCCEMSCSPLFVVETSSTALLYAQDADYHSVEASQLNARTSFGLKRPPRG